MGWWSVIVCAKFSLWMRAATAVSSSRVRSWTSSSSRSRWRSSSAAARLRLVTSRGRAGRQASLVGGAVGHQLELGEAAVLAQELHFVGAHRLGTRTHATPEAFVPERQEVRRDHAPEGQAVELVAFVAQALEQQPVGVDEAEVLRHEHAVGQRVHQRAVGALADAQRLLDAPRLGDVGHRQHPAVTAPPASRSGSQFTSSQRVPPSGMRMPSSAWRTALPVASTTAIGNCVGRQRVARTSIGCQSARR